MNLRKFSCFTGAAFVMAFLSGCGSGGSNNATAPVADIPVTTRSQYGPFLLTLTVPKTVYAKGETISIIFTITNTSVNPVAATVGPSKSDIRIQGNNFFRTTFSGGAGGLLADPFAPGESKAETVNWQLVVSDDQKISKGRYAISGRYATNEIREETKEVIGPLYSTDSGKLSPPPIEVIVQ